MVGLVTKRVTYKGLTDFWDDCIVGKVSQTVFITIHDQVHLM